MLGDYKFYSHVFSNWEGFDIEKSNWMLIAVERVKSAEVKVELQRTIWIVYTGNIPCSLQ